MRQTAGDMHPTEPSTVAGVVLEHVLADDHAELLPQPGAGGQLRLHCPTAPMSLQQGW